MSSCLQFWVKYALIIFNVAFLILSTYLIVIGSLMLKDLGGRLEQNVVPISIIIIGVIIFVIAFFGCCGACGESSCMTYTYSVFMVAIFCCQLVLVFYVLFWKESFLNSATKVVDQFWEDRHLHPQNFDTLQRTFSCCGKNGVKDYIQDKEKIPLSCCDKGATECLAREAFPQSCTNSVKDYFRNHLTHITIGGLLGSGLELATIIFSCILAGNYKSNNMIRGGEVSQGTMRAWNS